MMNCDGLVINGLMPQSDQITRLWEGGELRPGRGHRNFPLGAGVGRTLFPSTAVNIEKSSRINCDNCVLSISLTRFGLPEGARRERVDHHGSSGELLIYNAPSRLTCTGKIAAFHTKSCVTQCELHTNNAFPAHSSGPRIRWGTCIQRPCARYS